VKITGISNPYGMAGLEWRTSGVNMTIVTCFKNVSPWNMFDVTSSGTYANPGDQTLPVYPGWNLMD